MEIKVCRKYGTGNTVPTHCMLRLCDHKNFSHNTIITRFTIQCSLDYPNPLGPRLVQIIKKFG